MSASFIIVIALMLITLGILVVGLVGMAAGGEFNRKYGNKLMVLRVTFQALAIFAVFLLFAVK